MELLQGADSWDTGSPTAQYPHSTCSIGSWAEIDAPLCDVLGKGKAFMHIFTEFFKNKMCPIYVRTEIMPHISLC